MKKELLFLTSALFSLSLIAQPTINNVNGVVQDAQNITVTGSDFGQTGPNIVIYDEFEDPNVQDFDSIPYTSPIIGDWHTTLYNEPKYHPVAHSGEHSFALNRGNTTFSQLRHLASDPFVEVFISYWVKMANGIMPSASTPGEWNHASNWKMTWIYDGSKGYSGDNDMCTPSWNSSGGCYIGGNDQTFRYGSASSSKSLYLDNSWLPFTHWARFTMHMRADTADLTGWVGDAYVQTINEVSGQYEKIIHDARIFDTDSNNTTTKQWTQVNVPGWIGNWDGNREYFDGVYDDVYIATGTGAAARVELGNASTYSSCTNLALTTPISWSDNSITTTVRAGSFADCDQVYLYVTDKDYNVNQNGYPVTIAGTGCITGIEGDVVTSIQIYPNPTLGVLNIEGISSTDQITLTMKNILGEEVKVNQERFSNKMKVNTKHLSTGVYFLNMTYNKQESVYKIIKQD